LYYTYWKLYHRPLPFNADGIPQPFGDAFHCSGYLKWAMRLLTGRAYLGPLK
jgi:hypothetical protein